MSVNAQNSIPSKLQSAIQTTRPPFLILAPVSVLLGLSLAYQSGFSFHLIDLILIFAAALLAHASVNSLNEYIDFKSGLDLKTERTPFSGGSGALPNNPSALKHALILGLVSLSLTALIGLYFVYSVGLILLPLGIAGIALVALYSPWINRLPWVCLIAPGAGFGIIMVAGSFLVIAKTYDQLSYLALLLPFCLSNNLLLLNQYPDIHADKNVGRRTFPIVYGTQLSTYMLGTFYLVGYGSIAVGVYLSQLPVLALLSLITLPLSMYAFIEAKRLGGDIASNPKALAFNVISAIVSPLVLSISLFIA